MQFVMFSMLLCFAKAAVPIDSSYGNRFIGDLQTNERDDVVDLDQLEQYEETAIINELEEFVSQLDDEQLDRLEEILEEEEIEENEDALLAETLTDLGLEEEFINDLKVLSQDITEYLSRSKVLKEKLEMSSKDLSDNVKLYLLGLPNSLGPLGYIGLHSVLAEEEEEVVDVQYEFVQDRSKRDIMDPDEFVNLRRKRSLDNVRNY